MAPLPGETKVWQYITLMKRIYLIDCPGVVPPSNSDSEQDILLRGVVRVENVENPEQYITAVLAKTKSQHIERTYDVRSYKNSTEFLELLARKGGRLLKGGEADVNGVAKMILNDFLRGKIPWFTPPPSSESGQALDLEGREGRLGEMRTGARKRKLEDGSAAEQESILDSAEEPVVKDMMDPESFSGFSEDEDASAVVSDRSDVDLEPEISGTNLESNLV